MRKRLLPTLVSAVGFAVLIGLGLWSCENPVGPKSRTPSLPSLVVTAASAVTFVGAGDVASCSSNKGDEKTAAVIRPILAADQTAVVFNDGDMVYDNGTAAEYANCYD